MVRFFCDVMGCSMGFKLYLSWFPVFWGTCPGIGGRTAVWPGHMAETKYDKMPGPRFSIRPFWWDIYFLSIWLVLYDIWCYNYYLYIYIPFKDVTSSFDVSDFFNVSVPWIANQSVPVPTQSALRKHQGHPRAIRAIHQWPPTSFVVSYCFMLLLIFHEICFNNHQQPSAMSSWFLMILPWF